MMSDGSMMGSGIYSVDVSLDVECYDCEHSCEQDFATNDWGNVDTDVECPNCKTKFSFERELNDNFGEDADDDGWLD